MVLRLAGVRPGEGRDTGGAFLTLFGLMAGHAVLETARDALFLAKIPAARLPFVYLAIAAAAVVIARFTRSAGGPGRASLAVWTAGAAAVTLGFWDVVGRTGDWILYALYVWSGLLVTFLGVRFWLLAGDLFTVTQAKRLFAVVGSGSILGAVAGSALAQAIVARTDPRHLILAAAGVLFATALAPGILRRPEADTRRGAPPREPEGLGATARAIAAHPYVRRVALLTVVSTVTLTLVDLVFKSAVAEGVAAEQLGWVFASTYLVLNVLSLLAQLLIVGWMTRALSVDRVFATLPALLLLGSAWLLVGGGLLAAFLVKAFDGTFRHSLHRTASEVLSVPLATEWRVRVKGFVDVLGQRGGQAVASLGFLGLAAVGAPDPVFGALLVALSAVWIALASGLRRPYFDLFRSTLEEGSVRTRIDFPELDLASLETLMAALSSPDEGEVSAALDLLAEQERIRLVPPLILYHPSPKVVVRALELFERSGRTDHRRLLARLLERPEPEVRAAALLASPPGETDNAVLLDALQDPSPDVRATALIGLVCCQDVHPRVPSILETLLAAGSSEAKQALARAVARRPDPRFDRILLALAENADPALAREVARAMRTAPKPDYLPSLRGFLALREAREETRATLVALEDDALGFLAASLEDETLPTAVRRHLPRTLSRFEPAVAGTILLRRFPAERDGVVRFKILRALGHLRNREPGLPLDHAALEEAIGHTLRTVLRHIERRVWLERPLPGHPDWNTPVRQLMIELVRGKEEHALERLFRLFDLRYPRENFQSIHRGISSADRKARASARELLESVLRPPLRETVVGMLDDVPDALRLAAGRRYHRPREISPTEALRVLLHEGNFALRCLVAYHVAELGLRELREDLAALCETTADAAVESFDNALAMLDRPVKEKVFVVPVG